MNKYKYQKMLNILRYIVQREQKKYNIFVMLYFADKEHLSQYGRPVCDFNEEYIATEEGIFPSISNSILSLEDEFITISSILFTSIHQPDLDYLSESDIKCLKNARYKYLDITTELAIDLLKSQNCWKNTEPGKEISWRKIVKLDIENGQEILDYWDC